MPPRDSWEDDKARGVGNVVKLSSMPYWLMLGRYMREGIPHVFMRFPMDPIVLWQDASFGDRNIWEDGWTRGTTLEFARERAFVRKPQWSGNSPPEFYIQDGLDLDDNVVAMYTYMPDETRMLETCLHRLGIAVPSRLMTAGERNHPFPGSCHDDYVNRRMARLARIQEYFDSVTVESLDRGVELSND